MEGQRKKRSTDTPTTSFTQATDDRNRSDLGTKDEKQSCESIWSVIERDTILGTFPPPRYSHAAVVWKGTKVIVCTYHTLLSNSPLALRRKFNAEPEEQRYVLL
jgi:hypothetical protein